MFWKWASTLILYHIVAVQWKTLMSTFGNRWNAHSFTVHQNSSYNQVICITNISIGLEKWVSKPCLVWFSLAVKLSLKTRACSSCIAPRKHISDSFRAKILCESSDYIKKRNSLTISNYHEQCHCKPNLKSQIKMSNRFVMIEFYLWCQKWLIMLFPLILQDCL